VVRIFSFSFRRGIPKDETGHGGGLSSMPAAYRIPGREEKFKALTGKDAPVIDTSISRKARISSRQRTVAGGCERERLSAPRFYEPDGIVRVHGRPASLGVFRGATGEALRGRSGVEVVVRHLELENMNR
jgi:hypothetical protein